MDQNKVEKILDKLVEDDFFKSKETKLSPQEIEFLRNSPHLLEQLTDSSLIKKRYIYIVFFISIVMMITSKFFQYTKLTEDTEILNDMLTNVLFSISMEMLGACVIAYMLEVMFEKRLRKNQQLIEIIRSKIK